ncbi:MAG TPA: response regulator [Burkholderiaceae bacterium]|jgi:DNA-binding NtrC family response regulator|nr:response regulator [Burkholderiaceae bacterium]
MEPQRILLVDDEPHVLAALQRALRLHFGQALRIETNVDAADALLRARARTWDLVISDYRMPRMNGLEFLRGLRALQPHIVRIVLSASSDLSTIMRAVNEVGVFRYLIKPWVGEQLIEHVSAALRHAQDMASQRELADAMRVQRGELGAAAAEAHRLEQFEPGITHVDWGPNGEVLMPPLK